MIDMALRQVNENDHAWLVELHNDPEVLRNVTHPQPVTTEQHMRWWEKVSHDHRQLRMVFSVGDVRTGFAKFYDIDRTNNNCVLGADIHKDYRGRGYAKHMWRLMLDECFLNMELHRVSLTTASFNRVGQHVYKGLGFKEEGRRVQALYRDGAYHDMIDMYMLKHDWVNR